MGETENQGSDKQGENLDKPQLTVMEVSSMLGESVHVIRNWLKTFKTYIPVEKSEAGYNMFNEKAVEVVQIIQQLHRQNGYSMKQIEYYLMTGGREFVPKPSQVAEELLAKELKEVRGTLSAIQEQLDMQKLFNQALVEKLDRQETYIVESIQKRDEILVQTIREIQDTKRLEHTKDQEEKKRWWKFWK